MYEERGDKKDEGIVVYGGSGGYKWLFSYGEEKMESVNELSIGKDGGVVLKVE